MALGMSIEVQQDGSSDSVVLPIVMRHVVQWEKSFRGRALALLNEDRLMAQYVYELAWVAMGKPGDFDKFLDTYDVSPVNPESTTEHVDDGPVDPTHAVAYTAP